MIQVYKLDQCGGLEVNISGKDFVPIGESKSIFLVLITDCCMPWIKLFFWMDMLL